MDANVAPNAVDRAIGQIGQSCADLLHAIHTASSVDEALRLQQRAELALHLLGDVSTAALVKADLLCAGGER